ncbi:hypothetical protein [Dyella sp. 2RAB6]|uniref:hypothetical protein n=1 Tax=Dyella sp. 2RAB6 TaxID=3232992 RepID=UPI003F92CC91
MPGTRVRLTPREREAVQAYWSGTGSPQRAARRVLTAGSSVMATVGAFCLLVGVTGAFLGPRHLKHAWVLLMMGGMLLPMACFFLWAIRRNARRLTEDLKLGSKLVVDGIVGDRFHVARNGRTPDCLVRVVVPPLQEPGNFVVPERVFRGLGKGDAVRCAYLPTSKLLLSLGSGKVFHAIGDPP